MALVSMRQLLDHAAENGYGISGKTEVETYLRKSGMLEEFKQHLRLDVLGKDSTETRLIDGIKKLIS